LTEASAAVARTGRELDGEIEVSDERPSIRLGAKRLTPLT
jgi:hypothetical protein